MPNGNYTKTKHARYKAINKVHAIAAALDAPNEFELTSTI